jgi:hypothetical protein
MEKDFLTFSGLNDFTLAADNLCGDIIENVAVF